MINEKDQLAALLQVYEKILEDITIYQVKGDEASYSILTLFFALVGSVILLNDMIHDILILVCLSVPIILMGSLQRSSQYHTFVAMLRGYAANLEKEMNRMLGREYLLYNSEYIDKYIASIKVPTKIPILKNFRFSWFMIYLSNILPIVVCGIYVFAIVQQLQYKIFCVLWFLFWGIFIAYSCKEFTKKEEKRLDAARKIFYRRK